MKYDMRQAAQAALDVQDACNLSGVVHDWATIMETLWREADRLGEGTAWVNTHPIVVLFADKCASLAKVSAQPSQAMTAYSACYAQCQRLAAPAAEETVAVPCQAVA